MTVHLLGALALVLLVSAVVDLHNAPADFQAVAVTRTGHLQFDAPAATVFPLFTPEGERHWAKGWDPEILFPRDRDIAEGMVFRTRDGIDYVWTVTRYDGTAHTIAYNVVGERMLVRRIEIRCRPAGPSRTDVDVTDSYVGLSSEGNAFIDRLTESAYASKMTHWKDAIGGYLAAASRQPR